MRSIFVYNPESGKGKIGKNKDYIVGKLSQKYGEIDCVATEYAGHAQKLAKEAIGKYDYFFVSGGDGTLNEVVNGFGDAENKPIIGYIPAGTVNDVAHSLGLSKNIKKAVNNLLSGEVFEHDTFKVNNKFGIYICCSGLFVKTSYATARKNKKKLGKLAYFFNGCKDLINPKPTKVELTIGDEKIARDCAMLLIFNSRSVAGFMVNKQASLSDGEVEILIFDSRGKKHIWLRDILRPVFFFFLGVKFFRNNKHVVYRKASKFSIKMDAETVINLDGEKSGKGNYNFEVINKGVSIIVPKKHLKRDQKRKIKQENYEEKFNEN